MSNKALVRERIEAINGVSRTWFEHEDQNGILTRTLVVEVGFDTDPNSAGHIRDALETIERTARKALATETTMAVHGLRIVPRIVG